MFPARTAAWRGFAPVESRASKTLPCWARPSRHTVCPNAERKMLDEIKGQRACAILQLSTASSLLYATHSSSPRVAVNEHSVACYKQQTNNNYFHSATHKRSEPVYPHILAARMAGFLWVSHALQIALMLQGGGGRKEENCPVDLLTSQNLKS